MNDDEQYLNIEHGDELRAMIDPNGCAAIRVRNTVWQQPDRWLYVDTIERGRKIDALIAALTALRAIQRRGLGLVQRRGSSTATNSGR
ncbi:MAG: hypothetical protein IPM11_01355 [Micropruina sp.]|nr:hypothetical protein [Micropruina sp.]